MHADVQEAGSAVRVRGDAAQHASAAWQLPTADPFMDKLPHPGKHHGAAWRPGHGAAARPHALGAPAFKRRWGQPV